MSSEIETSIIETTGVKPQKKNEKREKFLARIVREVHSVDDEVWDALPECVQEWVNDGIEALNAKVPVAEFSDWVDDAAEESVTEAAEAKTTVPLEKEAADKKRGGSNRFRELLVEHPGMKKEDILDMVHTEGFKLSPGSAEVIFYESRAFLKVLQSLGKLVE